ncbi:hypothetical protein F8O06_00695 [Pseudoclavibacter sp. CFCC 14310]|uniref:hypothetical protein n=1 Tax=Pseudoclavibacter sp. CFCC 14310 TaxID=2615180 RepID=UPI00130126B8|nr:hypothetical protein [Pseudoclavibacter sp. CFCC 14310]KAB1647133.1 hypothetical protein F8O06_00695 [Pseudoclavibacter sp. CFCC 14310]
MTWFVLAALLGLVRLLWAPADNTLLLANVVLLIVGTIRILTHDLMTSEEELDDDRIRQADDSVRDCWAEGQAHRAA